ncbi:hypothetical protein V5799_010428 [Amblyomma americanum]|uniref:Uncharacterized protein n=1 Tax=Amblyomma americanum TaxID=6943 RepID=A0AAQ4EK01_AMBAM
MHQQDTSSVISQVAFFVKDMLCLYILSAYYLLWECFLRFKTLFSPRERISYESMENKTVVMTGGSGGIGHETMRTLLSLGARVIDGSPEASLTEERRRLLLEGHPTTKVELLPLDLSSMSSVKSFAERILENESKVDVLICNVMLSFVKLAINYLGHCLLIALLLPLLTAAGKEGHAARIVNVSSCAHKAASIDLDDLNGRKKYSCYRGYTQSKVAQVLFTISLGKCLQAMEVPVTVNCIHPGIVNTQLYQRVWWAPLVAGIFFKTPEESVKTVLHAALSNELEGITGCYLEECAPAQPLSLCNSRHMQERLWERTWTLLRPWLNEEANNVSAWLSGASAECKETHV